MKKSIIVTAFILTINIFGASGACVNKPLLGADMISDVCYDCMLPLKIAAVTVARGPMEDNAPVEDTKPVCICPMPPPIFKRIGIPISFYNASRVFEPVTAPLCFPSLGLSLSDVLPKGLLAGGDATKSKGVPRTFYQEHELVFPVLGLLEVMMDTICMENADMDVAYITEVDPLWNLDVLGIFMTPEAILFGNPIMGLGCMADAAMAQRDNPIDAMFWCKGSHGMAYPITGNVGSKGMVEDAASVSEGFIYKMHRTGLGSHDGLCAKIPTFLWTKSEYRLQIVKPVAHPTAFGIGKTGLTWDWAKNIPFEGDNFVFLRFKKKHCCAF